MCSFCNALSELKLEVQPLFILYLISVVCIEKGHLHTQLMLIPIYSQMKTSRNFTKKAYRALQVIVLCTSMCLPCAYHVFIMCLCVSAFIDYSCIYTIRHKKLTYAVNVTYHTTMGTGKLQVRVWTLCQPFCSDWNRSKMVVYIRRDDSECL